LSFERQLSEVTKDRVRYPISTAVESVARGDDHRFFLVGMTFAAFHQLTLTPPTTSVPEPSSLFLLLGGIVAAGLVHLTLGLRRKSCVVVMFKQRSQDIGSGRKHPNLAVWTFHHEGRLRAGRVIPIGEAESRLRGITRANPWYSHVVAYPLVETPQFGKPTDLQSDARAGSVGKPGQAP
jgi:hypothetical protein